MASQQDHRDMKSNTCPLYPNEQVGLKVTQYSYTHSEPLPPKVLSHHEWGLNHERAGYMISPSQSQFQMWLTRALGVKRVLEIGCFIGFSAMTWSEAVGKDGKVTTLEVVDEYADIAREAWKKEGYENIEVLVGDAGESLEKLASSNPEPYDLVFIDADKSSYPKYLDLVLSLSQPGSASRLVRPGGLIVADNVLRRGLIADDSTANPYALKVLEPAMQSRWKASDMVEIKKYNDTVLENKRLDNFLLPLFDGVNMARLLD